MPNNDNNQQLEAGKRKENKTPQKFTGKAAQRCQEGEKVRHLVLGPALDHRQECTAAAVGLGRLPRPGSRWPAGPGACCPGTSFLWGPAARSSCPARLPAMRKSGTEEEKRTLKKSRRVSWGEDYKGSVCEIPQKSCYIYLH